MSIIRMTHPTHGLFAVDADVLQNAVARYGNASTEYVRQQAAGAAGYPETFPGTTALDDCNLIEALIIWVESGNHTFGTSLIDLLDDPWQQKEATS